MKGTWSRRKQAAGWAGYDMEDIVLTPVTRTRTASGGYTQAEGTPRPIQRFGLASSRYQGGEELVSTSADGTTHRLVMVLIGPIGCLIDVGDRLTLNGIPLFINFIRYRPDGVYAEAVLHGG